MSGGAPNPSFPYPNMVPNPNPTGLPGLTPLPGLPQNMGGLPALPGTSGMPNQLGALPNQPGAPTMPQPGFQSFQPNAPSGPGVGAGVAPGTVPTNAFRTPLPNMPNLPATGVPLPNMPNLPNLGQRVTSPTGNVPGGFNPLPPPTSTTGAAPVPGMPSTGGMPPFSGLPTPTTSGLGMNPSFPQPANPLPMHGGMNPLTNRPTLPNMPNVPAPQVPMMPPSTSQVPLVPTPMPATVPGPVPGSVPMPGSSTGLPAAPVTNTISSLNTLSARPRGDDLLLSSPTEGPAASTSPFALNNGAPSPTPVLPPEPVAPGGYSVGVPRAPLPVPASTGAPSAMAPLPGGGSVPGHGILPPSTMSPSMLPPNPAAYPTAPPVGLPQGGNATSPSGTIGAPPVPGQLGAQTAPYVPPPYVVEPLSKYVSLCTSKAAANNGLRSRLQVPQGLIIRPFANPPRGAEPLPLVDFGGEEDVIRCNGCRTYITAYATFTLAGAYWTCNFCGAVNQVELNYFSSVDERGYRKDLDSRPELTHACYEMIAPSRYASSGPAPPTFLFVIDVSQRAVASGLVDSAASAILAALPDLPGGVRTRVGFVTVDSCVHIYKFTKGKQTSVYSLSDLDDVFTPCNTGLVTRSECMDEIRAFLTRLPAATRNTRDTECAAGAAIEVAHLLLQSTRGGRISLILGGLPTLGPGKLTNREPARAATAQESELLKLRQPADAFYTRVGRNLGKSGTTVDVYVASTQNNYVDVATLNELSRNSCGQLRYYPAFDGLLQSTPHLPHAPNTAQATAAQLEHQFEEVRRQNSSLRLQHDLRLTLTRSQAWEAMIRIRATKGVGLRNVFGNYTVDKNDLMCTPCIDCDKTFAIELHCEHHLTRPIFVQCALLYTTSCGQRRIRVITVYIPVSNSLEELFKSVDIDATASFLAKEAAVRAMVEPLPNVRESVLTQCVAMLRNYRAVTGRVNPNDYFGGADLARLSLMALGIVKCAAFRDSSDVRPDVRSAYLALLRTMSVIEVETLVRPRLMRVTNLDADVGLVNAETGVASLPQELSLKMADLSSADAYLVDNGFEMYLRLGRETPAAWLRDVFGVDDITHIRCDSNTSLPSLGYAGPHRTRLENLITYLRQNSGNFQPLHVIKEADPSEKLFFTMLIEDASLNTVSWAQFLNHIIRGS